MTERSRPDWEAAWQAGRTGWDLGASPPLLVELCQRGVLPDGAAVVPGCGAGYDVLALATERRQVTGVDLAPTARERFHALRAAYGVEPARAEVMVGDYLQMTPESQFDLAWDYTFLCALAPSDRPAWARAHARHLRAGGTLALLLFPVRPGAQRTAGPPYSVDPREVAELLAPEFELVELAPAESSAPSRRGQEWWGRFARRGG